MILGLPRCMWGTHWELIGNKLGTNWEQIWDSLGTH
jgi:hypothetical protein